jgi:predicted ATP-dependent Lon-type protease
MVLGNFRHRFSRTSNQEPLYAVGCYLLLIHIGSIFPESMRNRSFFLNCSSIVAGSNTPKSLPIYEKYYGLLTR